MIKAHQKEYIIYIMTATITFYQQTEHFYHCYFLFLHFRYTVHDSGELAHSLSAYVSFHSNIPILSPVSAPAILQDPILNSLIALRAEHTIEPNNNHNMVHISGAISS